MKRYFLILDTVLLIVALALFADISLSFARAGKGGLPEPPPPPRVEEIVQKVTHPYSYYTIIAERNLFAAGEEESAGPLEPLPGAAVSKLKLRGTIVVEGLEPLCIIEVLGTRKEEVYKIGDLVEGNEILTIERARVILRTPAGRVSLAVYGDEVLPELSPVSFPSVKKMARNRWALSRGELSSVISNPNQLLAQIEVTPYLVAGQVRGFKLENVEKGSLAESLGVRSGDIIKGVDGQKLDSIEKALQIYKAVKDRPIIRIEIERNGRSIPFTYEIRG